MERNIQNAAGMYTKDMQPQNTMHARDAVSARNAESVRNARATGNAESVRNARAAGNAEPLRNARATGNAKPVRNVRAAKNAKPVKTVKAAGKPDMRRLVVWGMGLFVLVAMGWGICQHIKGINTRGELITYGAVQGLTKVEDNTKNAGKTIDTEKLVQKILDNVNFDAELNQLDDSVAEGMLDTAEGTSLQFYAGNGIYADELIVMTARNEKDAKKNQENVKAHLTETKKAFQDYIPKEAEKIEQAVSIRCGCYVIVCVTSDYEKAEKTINAMIQE